MNNQSLLRTGIVGTLVTAICCFTPALVVMLSFLGLSAWLVWLDWILLPALVLFACVTLTALFFRLKERKMKSSDDIVLESTISCPQCHHQKLEVMPTNACQWFYECENCHTLLKPKKGDCCVFCSYGSVKCPPIQQNNPCCT